MSIMEPEWPWQYEFPPFFTIQPNESTRKIQVTVWCQLVLKYCKMNKKYIMEVNEATESPLFFNKKINRALPPDGIVTVLEALNESGNAYPVDKGKVRWLIFWHNPTEWGDIIYTWAQDNGQIDSVCTFYELQTSPNTEFNGMPNEVLIKILKVLEKKGSAELILEDDMTGVKFL